MGATLLQAPPTSQSTLFTHTAGSANLEQTLLPGELSEPIYAGSAEMERRRVDSGWSQTTMTPHHSANSTITDIGMRGRAASEQRSRATSGVQSNAPTWEVIHGGGVNVWSSMNSNSTWLAFK